MWRLRLAELYCVSTKMRRMSELMQFEIGMSTSRYLPPSGTAGFERARVSGERRVPAPPPRITARMFGLFGAITLHRPDFFLGLGGAYTQSAPALNAPRRPKSPLALT